ncbi:PLP-dependent aminotransferase family protein (plasmid) [Variovorax sp. V213]|uniref:MocR-like pyridoxine biosynthesis transcription factor PdxR n=1 Tax=Variovorax sp. V213 TaxID=3065955 RepID=UPI0034E8CFD8
MKSLETPQTLRLLEAPLDRSPGAELLQRQLHRRLKEAILRHAIGAGTKLPSSRELATELAVSRNTVSLVYEHLAAEGYIACDRRGTRVSTLTPLPPRHALREKRHPVTARRLSEIQLVRPATPDAVWLRPGVPSLADFPLAAWRRSLERALQHGGAALLNYGDPMGQMELRVAICRHLALTRGVGCEPEQIVITEGAIEGLNLCVRLLTDPGDIGWLENPCYRGARTAMQSGDLRIVPCRVDEEGLVWNARDRATAPPRLIYTTPSHQFPRGIVMSVARRLELIANAGKCGAWIIEDDYDGEFRYTGEPIAAMVGLVPLAPVIYVGSFSKTMFPSLRLGFIVLPRNLLAATAGTLREMLRGGNRHVQLAMADFMESGQFARHLGRMRRLYRARQRELRAALTQHLRVPNSVEGGDCGLHLTVRFDARHPDRKIAALAAEHQLAPMPLSALTLAPGAQDNGLVLGYGNTSAELFDPLVKTLATLVAQAR